jgi:hypothetical protein
MRHSIAFGGNAHIAFRRQLLQRQGAFDGADDRAELDQDPVAGRLDYPPAMPGDDWIGDGAVLAQCLPRRAPSTGCSPRHRRRGWRQVDGWRAFSTQRLVFRAEINTKAPSLPYASSTHRDASGAPSTVWMTSKPSNSGCPR